jgi:hypothetical protein
MGGAQAWLDRQESGFTGMRVGWVSNIPIGCRESQSTTLPTLVGLSLIQLHFTSRITTQESP